MTICSIKLCGKSSANSSSKTDGITFHRFPKDLEMKKKWITAADRGDGWLPTHNSVVCSRHFIEKCFHIVGVTRRRRINNSAVPTLFLPNEITEISRSSPKLFAENTRIHQQISHVRQETEPHDSAEYSPELYSDPVHRRLYCKIHDLTKTVEVKKKLLRQSRDHARRLETKLETLKIDMEELRTQQAVIKFRNGKKNHHDPSTSNIPTDSIKSEPNNVTEIEEHDTLPESSIERILRRKITELTRKLNESKQVNKRVRSTNTSLKKTLNMYKVVINKMKNKGFLRSEDVSIERLKSANRSLVEKVATLKKQLLEERKKNRCRQRNVVWCTSGEVRGETDEDMKED